MIKRRRETPLDTEESAGGVHFHPKAGLGVSSEMNESQTPIKALGSSRKKNKQVIIHGQSSSSF